MTARRPSVWLALSRRAIHRWLLVVVLALLWQGTSWFGIVDPILLPPLSRVLERAWELGSNGRLLEALVASAGRVLLGFTLAAAVALPLGVAMGLYPALERATVSLSSLLRPLSPPAWIPLAILWFGIGDAPAVFIIFIGTFFSLFLGILAATKGVDIHMVKAACTLGASRWQAVTHVVLPSVLPELLAQMRIGLGLAWMCVIAAEMVAVRQGLGFMMMEARSLFRTEDVLVGMLTIGLVGLGCDALLHGLERRLCRWRVNLGAANLYEARETIG